MNLVSALTILAKPMTVDADANFLLISFSCFSLLTFSAYIKQNRVFCQLDINVFASKLPVCL